MMETRQQKVEAKASQTIEHLQQAAMQAALDAAENGGVPTFAQALSATDQAVSKNIEKTRGGGLQGAGPGRPKGVRNKLTNLRDAVIEAFDRVGGVDYLVRLAEGTQSDRAAFVGLMNKVLPTQINQQVEGGIKLELSWLSGRQIGTTTAQVIEQKTQVLDLQRDSNGQYRIKHPNDTPAGGDGGQEPTAQKGAGDAQGG